MYLVFIDLDTRNEVMPFNSLFAAEYFVTSHIEIANRRGINFPCMTIVDSETSEVVAEYPEIYNEYYKKL